MTLRTLDLFSGIGGFALGLDQAGGFETAAFCEIGRFQRQVLRKHWPGAPIYEDIRDLTADALRVDGVGPIDIICGGFPCQPFSTASRGRRVAVDFWPHMARLIDDIRPAYAIAENVQEQAIANAAEHFRRSGYGAHYCRISGADLGADHQRDRWWAIAYPHAKGELCSAIYAEVAKLQAVCRGIWGAENYARAIRISSGVPDRLDGRERVEALGNAVFPQIPEAIGRAIISHVERPLA